MTTDIKVDIADGVQTLRFNRVDKKNALTGSMYAALADALSAGDKNPDVAAHVFLGAPGIFSAGNDIKDFVACSQAEGDLGADIKRFVRGLPNVKKPMIAAVDGAAIGIGTTLLLHCDLAYASPRATFATPFLDLGLVPEAGSSLIAPRLMGHPWAFELLVLGEPIDVNRALAAHLINAIVPSEELEAKAIGAARRLAAKPPEALRQARMLVRGEPAAVLDQIEREVISFKERLASPEAMEAFRAFLEKRPPKFART